MYKVQTLTLLEITFLYNFEKIMYTYPFYKSISNNNNIHRQFLEGYIFT